MANQNDNPNPKAFLKSGLSKITSKFGHASHENRGTSSLAPAISTTLSGAFSMTPAFAVAHKEEYYPVPDPSQAVQNPEATRYRGRVDQPTTGPQGAPNHSRLPGGGGNKKDADNNQKKDADKKQGESSKKGGTN